MDLTEGSETQDTMDDDNNSEGWNEMDADSETQLLCLFCPMSFKTMAVALEHCKTEHQFDLIKLKEKFKMDCYSYICLINYIRSNGSTADVIMSCTDVPWLNGIYMKPVLQDDPWLMFDFEDLETSLQTDFSPVHNLSKVKIENGLVTMTEDNYRNLIHSVQALQDQIEARTRDLSLATSQINEMKKFAQHLIENNEDKNGITDTSGLEDKVAGIKITKDQSYFNTYSHFGIHHEMLSDQVRTESYRDALYNNKELISNKLVLDLGCGTGILSMFSVVAGASKVIGVDQSDVIYYAMDIVRENNLADKIDLVKGRVENVNLSVDQVDVIVSEWMGYFLLFEGMLDSVIIARDKYLKPGGLLLPNRCSLSLVGISDMDAYNNQVEFWSDVYSFKMSCLKKEVIREALISNVLPSSVITTSFVLLDLNLLTCTFDSLNFVSNFALESLTNGAITAFAGYFDAFFDLPSPTVLSTSPDKPPTHWKQTIFYLPEPLYVTAGQIVEGQLSCRKCERDRRSLEVQISLGGKNMMYLLT